MQIYYCLYFLIIFHMLLLHIDFALFLTNQQTVGGVDGEATGEGVMDG